MSPLPFFVVDAFTERAFGGNPAAVVLFDSEDHRAQDSNLLLKLSQEFNYQETAFLVPLPSTRSPSNSAFSTPTYSLRWFTPVVEFPMCGHATLASACVLFTERFPDENSLRFETLSGTLWAQRLPGNAGIELDFPADLLESTETVTKAEELQMMAAVERSCPEVGGRVVGWAKGELAWIIELEHTVDLAAAHINVAPFIPLGGYVIFTQAAPPDAAEDLRSRVLDPVEVAQEDPVTGSAHCALAVYWNREEGPRSRLRKPLSAPDTLRARQVSKRGGDLRVEWHRDTGRVKLIGAAKIVMQGTLAL